MGFLLNPERIDRGGGWERLMCGETGTWTYPVSCCRRRYGNTIEHVDLQKIL